MDNCRGCEGCPFVGAAQKQMEGLEGALHGLADRETQRQEQSAQWDTLLLAATPEERRRETIVDGERAGNMYEQRDLSTAFATLADRADADMCSGLNAQLAGLRASVKEREEACTKGPGKRFGLLGATVCRSGISD